MSPRESTQRHKVELWERNVRYFCLNAELNVTFRDILHACKATTWDRWIYFPSEGRCADEFFALKIRQIMFICLPNSQEETVSLNEL